MPGLQALPADQRAVLQLLLRQGRSFAEIARALRLEPDAVRRRAHAGLTGIVAPPAELSDDERETVGDWLLGQREDEPASLRRHGAARAWAAALGAELAPVAARPLPELPELPEAEDPEPEPAAAGAPATERASRRPGRPSSRRGGAILLAAAAVVAVIVAVVLLAGNDGKSSGTTASSSSSTAAASPSASTPRVLGQVNLTAPSGAPAAKALGVVQLVDVNGKQAINAIVQGLPQTKKAGYGIWLLGDGAKRQWLGYFRNVDQQGRLVAQGQLDKPIDVGAYPRMSVTKETAEPPKQPGRTYLVGAIQAAPQTGAGTSTTPGGSGG